MILIVLNWCVAGIRHPEELSLARKLDREELKKNKGISATRKARGPVSPNNHTTQSNSFDGTFTNSPLRTPPTPQVSYHGCHSNSVAIATMLLLAMSIKGHNKQSNSLSCLIIVLALWHQCLSMNAGFH